MSSLNPAVHFQVGDVTRLPLFPIDRTPTPSSRQLETAFGIHESHREPSVEFRRPGPSPWRHAQDWAQAAVDRPEGAPLPEYAEQLDPEPPTDHLSFALGVALGRFGPPAASRGHPRSRRRPTCRTPCRTASSSSTARSTPRTAATASATPRPRRCTPPGHSTAPAIGTRREPARLAGPRLLQGRPQGHVREPAHPLAALLGGQDLRGLGEHPPHERADAARAARRPPRADAHPPRRRAGRPARRPRRRRQEGRARRREALRPGAEGPRRAAGVHRRRRAVRRPRRAADRRASARRASRTPATRPTSTTA